MSEVRGIKKGYLVNAILQKGRENDKVGDWKHDDEEEEKREQDVNHDPSKSCESAVSIVCSKSLDA